MRAVYQPGLIQGSQYSLKGDALHHLLHVVRIEVGEDVLLLAGDGTGAVARVESATKKEIQLKHLKEVKAERMYEYDLILGIPKKEALESSLKAATELGVRRIILVRSEYSQEKLPDSERVTKLLVSAVEQANAFYFPELRMMTWEEVPWHEYGEILLMNSQSDEAKAATLTQGPATALVVGPEGGFSPRELAYFQTLGNLRSIQLPTPILRTLTAVPTVVGFLLGRLLNR